MARHKVAEIDEPGTEEELRKKIASLPPNERMLAASNTDNFAGNDRKAAKTSIAQASVQHYSSLSDLLDSLPDDIFMRLHHNPPITEDADQDRVDEEERNVVVNAFLFATKKEADNDYHLILGNNADGGSFMTAEVSGLPARNPTRAALKIPRNAFQEYFSDHPVGTSYRKFDPPIAVKVTGSLFYDMDHVAGVVGPTGYKPKTSWEIHPVTEIEFEEE